MKYDQKLNTGRCQNCPKWWPPFRIQMAPEYRWRPQQFLYSITCTTPQFGSCPLLEWCSNAANIGKSKTWMQWILSLKEFC